MVLARLAALAPPTVEVIALDEPGVVNCWVCLSVTFARLPSSVADGASEREGVVVCWAGPGVITVLLLLNAAKAEGDAGTEVAEEEEVAPNELLPPGEVLFAAKGSNEIFILLGLRVNFNCSSIYLATIGLALLVRTPCRCAPQYEK